MTTTYSHILDLAKEAEPPADGILSRTIFQDDQVKVVIFGFGQGLGTLRTHGGKASHALLRQGQKPESGSVTMFKRLKPGRGSTCLRT